MTERAKRQNALGGISKDLDEFRPLVKALYVDEDMTLNHVMDVLSKEHGVTATKSMLKKRIRRWRLQKTKMPRIMVYSAVDKSPDPRFLGGSGRASKSSYMRVQGVTAMKDDDDSSANESNEDGNDYSRILITTTDVKSEKKSIPIGGEFGQFYVGTVNDSHMYTKRLASGSRMTSNSPILRGDNFELPSRSLMSQEIIERWQQKKTLKSVSLPLNLKAAEEMLYYAKLHISRRVALRMFPKGSLCLPSEKLPSTKWRNLPTPYSLDIFQGATNNAFNSFDRKWTARITASLEQACQTVEDILRDDHFSIMMELAELGGMTKLRGMTPLGRVLIKQAYDMALIVFGNQHPYIPYLRNLMYLLDVDGVFEAVLEASADSLAEVLGPRDAYSCVSRQIFIRQKLQNSEDQDSHLSQYKAFFEKTEIPTEKLQRYVLDSVELAMVFQRRHDYARVEAVLSQAEYLIDRCAKEIKPAKQVWGTMIKTLTLLGHALASQGKFDEAKPLFAKGISMMTDLLGHDHPATLETIALWGKALETANLKEDANAMYQLLDDGLAPFMLHA